MRRYLIILGGLLLASWLSPVKGTDVGQLQPVELVQVYRQGEYVVISTDTGDIGKGTTLRTALKHLKGSTPGTVFLDTADYLLLTVETEELLSDLAQVLRPGTEVCLVNAPVDGEKAAGYLSAHKNGVSIRSMRYEELAAPVLQFSEGRFYIAES